MITRQYAASADFGDNASIGGDNNAGYSADIPIGFDPPVNRVFFPDDESE